MPLRASPPQSTGPISRPSHPPESLRRATHSCPLTFRLRIRPPPSDGCSSSRQRLRVPAEPSFWALSQPAPDLPQLFKSLKYMHTANLLHRDVKARSDPRVSFSLILPASPTPVT